MTAVVDIKKARLAMAAKRGYRNWRGKFGEVFGLETRLSAISSKALAFLAQGGEESAFYLNDLIMNLLGLGSGFQFDELKSEEKIGVVDRYLFLLDRIRFEFMKRLGWLEGYPGEEFALVELIVQFEQIGSSLQAKTPALSRKHPAYDRFCQMDGFEREELIRKLIPKALQKDQGSSTTL